MPVLLPMPRWEQTRQHALQSPMTSCTIAACSSTARGCAAQRAGISTTRSAGLGKTVSVVSTRPSAGECRNCRPLPRPFFFFPSPVFSPRCEQYSDNAQTRVAHTHTQNRQHSVLLALWRGHCPRRHRRRRQLGVWPSVPEHIQPLCRPCCRRSGAWAWSQTTVLSAFGRPSKRVVHAP